MAMRDVRKSFQNQIRKGIDQKAIEMAHRQRVIQSLLMDKYRSIPQTNNKGDKLKDGREK